MVKNSSGGNKSRNIGSKFVKKNFDMDEPDFENSFFGEIITKPNGMMANVKIIEIPERFRQNIPEELSEYLKDPIQVNIGKMKHDKRNNLLSVGDIVQVEINLEMNRQNGKRYAYILCKYSSNDIREFRKRGMIFYEKEAEDDIFEGLDCHGSSSEQEMELEDL